MRHCCAGGCGRGFLRCRISTTSCRRLSPACCGHPDSPRTCEARFGQRNAGRISKRVMLITRGNWAGRWSSVHPAPLVARGQTQRGQIPGGAGARSLEARTAGQIWLGLPATLQPRFKPDRVRLETNPAKRSPQCLLPTIGLGCRIGRKTIRPLVGTESRTYSSLPAMTRNQ